MMKALLLCIMVGLLIKLAFSTVIVYWFPAPHAEQSAWGTPTERALETAEVIKEVSTH